MERFTVLAREQPWTTAGRKKRLYHVSDVTEMVSSRLFGPISTKVKTHN